MCSVRGREPGLGALELLPDPAESPAWGSAEELAGAARPEEEPMFSPTITTTRPYPCDPSRHATGRDLWARLTARIARFVEVGIQEYHARSAMRRLREFDDQLLRDIGVGRSEIECVVRNGRPPR